jgi:hypothetical protein
MAVIGVKGKVRAVISEVAKANWMKAHRKLRKKCWYADGEVHGKVEIICFERRYGEGWRTWWWGESTVRISKFELP